MNQIELDKLSIQDLILLREELWIMIDISYRVIIEQELDKRIKLIFPDYNRHEDDNLKYSKVRL